MVTEISRDAFLDSAESWALYRLEPTKAKATAYVERLEEPGYEFAILPSPTRQWRIVRRSVEK